MYVYMIYLLPYQLTSSRSNGSSRVTTPVDDIANTMTIK